MQIKFKNQTNLRSYNSLRNKIDRQIQMQARLDELDSLYLLENKRIKRIKNAIYNKLHLVKESR
jgi:hypothetical protein